MELIGVEEIHLMSGPLVVSLFWKSFVLEEFCFGRVLFWKSFVLEEFCSGRVLFWKSFVLEEFCFGRVLF